MEDVSPANDTNASLGNRLAHSSPESGFCNVGEKSESEKKKAKTMKTARVRHTWFSLP
jgi:hypothetical protein